MIQIEVKIEKTMPLLCKECNGRRFPIAFPEQRDALWLCEKCKNFVDIKDEFVREWTEEEINENKAINNLIFQTNCGISKQKECN